MQDDHTAEPDNTAVSVWGFLRSVSCSLIVENLPVVAPDQVLDCSWRSQMVPADYFQLMARYNRWMNQNLFSACAEIPDAERRKDMGAFFGSVHRTLDHIFWGDTAWMNRFAGKPVGVDIGQELHTDFTSLTKAREAMDDTIIRWADQLDGQWLSADFEYTSSVDGKTRLLPAWILVTHMFNHQTHHRGQVTTLLKQLGHDPGVTDIPWMPELHSVIG